jgi:hypothetical protein
MSSNSAATNFSTTLKSFCDELRLTFPELSAGIDRASTLAPAQFWKMWCGHLHILLERNVEKLIAERRGLLIGAVMLPANLWKEISGQTQQAIWKYLRTLTLEAAMDQNLETLDTAAMQAVLDILTEERLDAGGNDAEAAAKEMMEETMDHMKPMMDKLKGLLSGIGMDGSGGGLGGGLGSIPMPEIPEHLRNGRIAKLAEELAKQFDPVEFGIDPEMLKGDNMEEVLKRLAEIYQRDPTKLMGGAKRVAERIKNKIMGGSINRDDLIAEAKEFVQLFKDHPLFKEGIAKFEGLVGAGGLAEMFGSGGGGGAPSERRRAVQERLRKKMEARKGTKK